MYNLQKADDMVECPYNDAHRMLRKRLQAHLIKCRVNYPDVELQKCPFDQTHLIPEPEFVHHVTNCSGRKLVTQYKYDAPAPQEENRVKHEPIQCDENWDDVEVEDYDPKKYVQHAKILRKLEGGQPAERKAFIKQERKRLGDYDSSEDENENETKLRKLDLDRPNKSKGEPGYVYTAQRPLTPPAPTNITWSEDVPDRSTQNKRRSRKFNDRGVSGDEEIAIHRRSRSKDYLDQSTSKEYICRNDERTDYNPDDDPYYNGEGNRVATIINENFRNAGHLSGRGSHRGRVYLGARQRYFPNSDNDS